MGTELLRDSDSAAPRGLGLNLLADRQTITLFPQFR